MWLLWVIGIGLSCLLLAGLLYWLLVTTEGVFLGRRVVVWLYDITAHRYDAIKKYTLEEERELVVAPILDEIRSAEPLLLDVATGTGRTPYFLLEDGRFQGRIVGLDASWGMLQQAQHNLAHIRAYVDLVQQVAGALPFRNQQFDGVISLEALEFFPSDRAALAEMVRVLRPGGFLMVTRRRGREARLFLRRYRSLTAFENLLYDLRLCDIITLPWQNNYDLVLGRKPHLSHD